MCGVSLNTRGISVVNGVSHLISSQSQMESKKIFGRDHGVRESLLRREDQLVRSENIREDIQGNSQRSQTTDETKDDAEAQWF